MAFETVEVFLRQRHLILYVIRAFLTQTCWFKAMSIKHVLVTGANGFIGQHLCRELVESGKVVTACIREQADDSVFAGIRSSLRICRMPSLGADGDFSTVFDQVDAVIHLAGRAHVMHETSPDPINDFRKVNTSGTESLALAAVQKCVKRFVFISSIKVNGEATNGIPFYADDPLGYRDSYAQSKWEGEERLRQIAEKGRMEWVIVRPPLVYGPGVRGNFLALLKCIRRRIPLPVGSLSNRRSLVSVFNLCDFLEVLLDHPAAANNRFLVADREDVSTPDLIRRVAAALHCPARIIPCRAAILRIAGTALGRKAAVQRLISSLVLDRQKAIDVVGWNAPITLEWGLDRTAEWFLKKAQ